jgi:hypothetical protein
MCALKLRSPISLPRRDDGTLLPAMLVAALVLMAALQLVLTREPDLPESGEGRLPPAARIGNPPPAIADPAIAARPLFSPSRRPGDTPVLLTPNGAAPLGGATVAGAIKAHGIARVLLKLPNGAIEELGVGGDYMGWVLVSFSQDGAIFRKGSEKLAMAYGAAGAAPVEPASEEQ